MAYYGYGVMWRAERVDLLLVACNLLSVATVMSEKVFAETLTLNSLMYHIFEKRSFVSVTGGVGDVTTNQKILVDVST